VQRRPVVIDAKYWFAGLVPAMQQPLRYAGLSVAPAGLPVVPAGRPVVPAGRPVVPLSARGSNSVP